jgi:hypothetical protein
MNWLQMVIIIISIRKSTGNAFASTGKERGESTNLEVTREPILIIIKAWLLCTNPLNQRHGLRKACW